VTSAPARGAAVVIGVGNELRGDDSAGLLVAQRLRERTATQADVLVCEADPAELLTAWTGADVAIVVDTVVSGAAPGTIQRFDVSAAPLPTKLIGFSTHAFGVGEAIELARALDRLPSRTIVYGIEGSSFSAGAPLDPAVERAIDETLTRIMAELAVASLTGAPCNQPTART
jgi:hydrogenase maturation protease